MFGVVLGAVEAEHLVEDRLDDLLPRIGFAAYPFAFQAFAGGLKLAGVQQRRPGIGKAAGNCVHVLAAKQRVDLGIRHSGLRGSGIPYTPGPRSCEAPANGHAPLEGFVVGNAGSAGKGPAREKATRRASCWR